MDVPETEPLPETPPNRVAVVGLLILAAAVFSYLIAYAGAGALAAADVLRPWPPDHDPRMMWMASTFGTLLGLFAAGAIVARLTGSRQLRRIDAMSEEHLEKSTRLGGSRD